MRNKTPTLEDLGLAEPATDTAQPPPPRVSPPERKLDYRRPSSNFYGVRRTNRLVLRVIRMVLIAAALVTIAAMFVRFYLPTVYDALP